eukprot:INCI4572.1.p1 GENE.INCI4572.1~~INCI4572.1.p1  ORF type:complete len:163 (-),score=31.45 INCI4572.1:385-873(-)
MNHRQFAPERRALKWGKAGRSGGRPESVYGSSPDDAPAVAWLRRMRSDSDVDQQPETNNKENSSGQGSESPNESPAPVTTSDSTMCNSDSTGTIEVVANNIVCYNGEARIAPSYIIEVGATSSTERFEKCNSCDDLVKVFNGSTWGLLRGKDVDCWERVSDK